MIDYRKRKQYSSSLSYLFLIPILALQALAAGLLLLFSCERLAFGYTDPGSGALIWQMLAASFIGVTFYFRKILLWIKGVKRKKGEPGQNAHPSPDQRQQ